jgi:hypothetical protein
MPQIADGDVDGCRASERENEYFYVDKVFRLVNTFGTS